MRLALPLSEPPSCQDDFLLRVAALSKTYVRGDDRVAALCAVDVTLKAACFAALSGPSGSGKSTLLNIVGTLDRPDSGQVSLAGNPIDFDDPAAIEVIRRERIGFIFQNFNLLPVLSAVENVELPLLMGAMSAKERRRRAGFCLEAVGLGDRMAHFPRQLSGGQQQRVAVARALVGDPILVLADEPTANLDSQTAEGLLALMQQLNRERGTGFLFSTHDPRVLAMAATIIPMQDGRILA